MIRLSVLIVFCALSLIFISNNLLGGNSRYYFGNQRRFIEDTIAKELIGPNRWGYSIMRGPNTTDVGLIFHISLSVVIRDLSFTSPDEAQQLFLDIYKDYIKKLNSIREIRPYLVEFPLTVPSCDLCLQFFEDPAKRLPSPHFIAVLTFNGRLQFMVNAPGDGIIHERRMIEIPEFKSLYEPKCPRSISNKTHSLPKFDLTYYKLDYPVYRSEMKKLLEICSAHNLTITTMGTVGQFKHGAGPFEFALRGSQQMDLAQARALASQCNTSLLNYINHDPEFISYLKEWYGYNKEKHLPATPIPEHIAYRFSFWDENIDRPVAPYIAEIRLLDGKMSYYTADENQRLILVHEETFQESLGRYKTDNEKSVQ